MDTTKRTNEELLGEITELKKRLAGTEANLKAATEKLSEDENRESLYRSAIEAAFAVPYQMNHTTNNYDRIGTGVERLTGYSAKEFKPDIWKSMVVDVILLGDLEGILYKDARRLIREHPEKRWRADFHISTRHGEDRWIADASAYVLNKNGEVVGSIGILQDITERKQNEQKLKRERDLMQALLQVAPDYIYFKDKERRYVRASRSFATLLGSSVEDLIGRTDDDLFSEDIALDSQAHDNFVMSSGSSIINREESAVIDGERRWVLTSKIPHRDENDDIVGLCGMSRDITELRIASEDLQRSEIRFRGLMEQSPVAFTIWSCDGILLEANEANEKLWGVSAEGLIGVYNLLAEPQVSVTGIQPYFEKALEGFPQLLPDREDNPADVGGQGQPKWLRSRVYPLRDSLGKVQSVVMVHEDLTERVRAQRALVSSELKWRMLVQSIPSFVAELSLGGVIISLNKVQPGLSRDDYLGKSVYEVLAPGNRKNIRQAISDVLGSGEPVEYEATDIGPHHETAWYHHQLAPVVENGEIRSLIAIVNDITERKKMERDLTELSRDQEVILDSVPSAIWYKDTENNIIRTNKAAAESVGMKKSAMAGVAARELFPEDAAKLYKSDLGVIESGRPSFGVVETRTLRSGKTVWVQTDRVPHQNADGEIVGIVSFVTDITSRKKLEEALKRSEEKLSRSQKIEAIGELAAGVAHDFNNLLTPILGYSDMITLDTGISDTVRDGAIQIRGAAEKRSGAYAAASRVRQKTEPRALAYLSK